MPRRHKTSHRNVIPIKWYFCPVETCCKSLPSKTAYTRHIRSHNVQVHSDLDFVAYNMPQPTNNDELLSSDSDQAGMQVDFDPSSDVVDDYEVYQQQSPLPLQPGTSPRQTRSSSQVTASESISTQRPSFRLPKECLPDKIEYHLYIYGKFLFLRQHFVLISDDS